MKAEQIDLSTAVKGDKFITRGGNEVIYNIYISLENVSYPHVLVGEDVYDSYTTEGVYCNSVKTHDRDIVSKVVEESAQDTLNNRFLTLINEVTDTVEESSTNAKLTLRLFEFLEKRLDSAENRVDILMSDRGEAISKRFAEVEKEITKATGDEVLKNRNTIISDYLHGKESCITPEDLMRLGFTEEYQPDKDGVPGFVYYSFDSHGVVLLSSVVGSDEDFYVFFEDQYEIRDLVKLGNLITSLNDL